MTNTPVAPSVGKLHAFRRRGPLTTSVVVAVLVWPAAASACTVCLGDPDSAMTEGDNKGILVLLGCVAAVQAGFLALFLSFRSRARRLERHRERFSLIEGGVK